MFDPIKSKISSVSLCISVSCPHTSIDFDNSSHVDINSNRSTFRGKMLYYKHDPEA